MNYSKFLAISFSLFFLKEKILPKCRSYEEVKHIWKTQPGCTDQQPSCRWSHQAASGPACGLLRYKRKKKDLPHWETWVGYPVLPTCQDQGACLFHISQDKREVVQLLIC